MRLRILLSAAVLAAGAVLGGAQVASAATELPAPVRPAGAVGPETAFGSTPIGSFEYSWEGFTIRIPAGCFLTHLLTGSGRRIAAEHGGTDCVGPAALGPGFCNWRLDFKYYDANDDGKLYSWNKDKTHDECATIIDRIWNYNPNFNARSGPACVVLMVNGAERGRQCHSIHG